MGSAEKCANRGLGTKAKKCLYEGIILPMVYGAEAWGMRSADLKESECSLDEVFEMFGWSVTNG